MTPVYIFVSILLLACHASALPATEVTGYPSWLPTHPTTTNHVDVRDHGGVGDGKTVNTEAFASAIAAAHAAGGGLVDVAGGHYLTGSIQLLSGVYLNVASDGIILGSAARGDWPMAPTSLIRATNQTNVGIVGSGLVDGQQPLFVDHYSRAFDQLLPVTGTPTPPMVPNPWHSNCTGGDCRPMLVVFDRCENVIVRDVTLTHSPMWTNHILGCTNVLYDNVTVFGDYRWPNGDGIDPDSTVNMTIRNTYVTVGDDAICPKSTSAENGYGPLKNLLIEDCVVRSRSSGFKIGSATFNDIDGVLVKRLFVHGSNRGLAIQHRDEGSLSNVRFEDVIVDGTHMAPHDWWGAGEGIWLTSIARTAGSAASAKVGMVSNIYFKNVTVRRSEGTVLISSRTSTPIKNITLDGVKIAVGDWMPRRQGVQYENHVHDYRPASPGAEEFTCTDSADGPCDGVYFKNVDGASVVGGSGVTFVGDRGAPANAWWGGCIGHDASSSGVAIEADFGCRYVAQYGIGLTDLA